MELLGPGETISVLTMEGSVHQSSLNRLQRVQRHFTLT